MKNKHVYIPLILSAILLGQFSCTNGKQEQKNPPNFIIIFADDLGYGDLGCFGHPTIKTPNLDKMAQEGMKLTQFYTAASICTPSRAGLLTGKLPIRTGMCGERGVLFPDSGGGLSSTEPTIAKVLKTKNYQTACIGKWHLGHLPQYLPTEHGFDYYFGIPYSNDMSPDQVDWDYAKENFPPLPLMEGTEVLELEPDQSRLTQRYTQKAVEFIEQNKEQPFFLYLPHTFPHTPLYVDEVNEGRSKRGLYGDVVEVLDWSVGEILNTLKRNDLAENTFVLFTSDNGPWAWRGKNGGSAGLLRGAKGSPWEGGFRVPTIAWMPGTVPEQSSSDALATTLDIFPTALNKAGVDISQFEMIDGVNIWPVLTQKKEVRNEVFYYRKQELHAYRNGTWKIHFLPPSDLYTSKKTEKVPLLYNINEDPSEKHNLAMEHPELIEELTLLAEKHKKTIIKTPSQLDKIQEKYIENH